MIYTIYDNPDFTAEIAYILSKYTDKKVLAIDADPINPSLMDLFNITKEPLIQTELDSKSGFNIIMDILSRTKEYDQDLFSKCTVRYEKLSILTGNDSIAHYEYYLDSAYKTLLTLSNAFYDYVIINVNRNVYDLFTIQSLILGDKILFPLPVNMIYWTNIINQMNYLKQKQGIKDKDEYILFKDCFEQSSVVKCLVDSNKYLGSISYDENRIKCRNEEKQYVKQMPEEILKQYFKIMDKLNIAYKYKTKRSQLKLLFRKKILIGE